MYISLSPPIQSMVTNFSAFWSNVRGQDGQEAVVIVKMVGVGRRHLDLSILWFAYDSTSDQLMELAFCCCTDLPCWIGLCPYSNMGIQKKPCSWSDSIVNTDFLWSWRNFWQLLAAVGKFATSACMQSSQIGGWTKTARFFEKKMHFQDFWSRKHAQKTQFRKKYPPGN